MSVVYPAPWVPSKPSLSGALIRRDDTRVGAAFGSDFCCWRLRARVTIGVFGAAFIGIGCGEACWMGGVADLRGLGVVTVSDTVGVAASFPP